MLHVAKILVTYVTLVACFQTVSCSSFDEFDIISRILGQGVALLAGQKYESDDLVPKAFRDYAMNDDTNEELGHATPQDMIARAGFNYENHYVVADDGYITQMVRIINPLADQSRLKQPPVMLQQGGITDISIWIWGSIAQHHPEKYPRTVEDGPITSWNRSMAFTLSNNGYDVWLVSHRGSNEQNQAHIDLKSKHKMPGRKHLKSRYNQTFLADLSQNRKQRGLLDTLKYWDYTFDDVADYEVPRQIDRILQVTGSPNISLFPMSFSTIYGLMALSRHPQYQRKIHNMVVVGPIISNQGTNRALGLFTSSLCNLIPVELGNLIGSELIFSQSVRDVNLSTGLRKDLRYTVLLQSLLPLGGPSARFQTLLEPAVYGHVLMPTSFKMIKHFCQIVTAGKMRRFDHGPVRNKKLYGDFFAPDYNMEVLNFGNWLMISGDNDVLAPVKSCKSYMKQVKPKPLEHIAVKGYNHLDLWAAIDNDVKINLPVLGFLDNFHIPPQES